MHIEIKNRWTGNVIFGGEYATIALCLAAAISAGADLRSANLSAANLSAANLYNANLSAADLSAANLSAANLYNANLSAADLSAANLYNANLRSANLSAANLSAANLYNANLSAADLYNANLYNANLYNANLSAADLYNANLYNANLYNANLSAANLSAANLRSADLRSAKGISVAYTNDLELMLLQTGKIRALKVVTLALQSPMQTDQRIQYALGESVEVPDASTDPLEGCGKGIHVCSPKFFVQNARSQGWTPDTCVVLIVEFGKKDIACIPYSSEGKFRLFRCTPVSKVSPEQLKAWLAQGETEATEDK